MLFFYLILSFTADIFLITVPASKFPRFNFTALSLFTLIEYTVFTGILLAFINNRILRLLIIVSSIGFYLFSISYYFLETGKQTFDSLPASVESILIIVYCIFFYFEQINSPEITLIYESFKFWIVTGFFIYLAGGLFLFIFSTTLTKQQHQTFWNINYFFNILKNVFFIVSFCLRKSYTDLNIGKTRTIS